MMAHKNMQGETTSEDASNVNDFEVIHDKMIRKNADLLQYITEKLLKESEDTIIAQSFSSGEKIVDQKKRVFSVYIIKSGITKCYLTEDNGVDFIQEFFGEGEIF